VARDASGSCGVGPWRRPHSSSADGRAPACVCGWPSRPTWPSTPRVIDPGRAVVRGQHLPASSRPAPRSPPSSGACPRLLAIRRRWPTRWRAPRAHHLDAWPVHHLGPGGYVPGRLHRPGTFTTFTPSTAPRRSCPARSPPSASTRGSTRSRRRRTSPPRGGGDPLPVARQFCCRAFPSASASYRTSYAILGLDELGEEDASRSRVPARSSGSCPAVHVGGGLHV